MFRNISSAACALAVGVKKELVDCSSGESVQATANRSCLIRCIPAVHANSDNVYVGDRIKKAVGFPQLTACCKPLRYKDFIISYDTKNRIPNWVYEHLYYNKLFKDDPCDKRPLCSEVNTEKPKFHPDCRIHGYHRSDVKDYCDSDYELGLMADPANYPYDCEAASETQVMTNVVPIVPGFSCGPWFDLQCYIRDTLVKEHKSVYVCSGPLFLPQPENQQQSTKSMKFDVLGEGEVSVPTHFFKVIIIETLDGNLELESYMMPNKELDDSDLDKYLTPLCKIEHYSGLIFFPEKKVCFTSNNKRRGAMLHAL